VSVTGKVKFFNETKGFMAANAVLGTTYGQSGRLQFRRHSAGQYRRGAEPDADDGRDSAVLVHA
jgi:hypothetical protein